VQSAFLVECFWPGVTREFVELADRRARQQAVSLQREGSSLRFLGSWFVPSDETVFFQYLGSSYDDVIRAAGSAGLPFDRVTPSLWLDSAEL
jgi:hypothetical protein